MDAPDVYADQFQVTVNPWGVTLNFQKTSPDPPPQGAMPQSERVATIRTGAAHLKAMIFMMKRQVDTIEKDTGVRADVPTQVLSAMGIGREDWDSFWGTR